MRTSESVTSVAAAWVVALNALDDIARDNVADTGSYRYKYATLDQATKQAREVLGQHGLGVHQEVSADQLGSVSVTTRVWHTSGEWIESAPLVMPAKGGAQDVGSATSYGRRYALMAFLGLATDDDDGAGAQAAAKKADEPHPNAERVSTVLADMKKLTDTGKAELKTWADGRALSGGSMIRDEHWLSLVEDWLSEYENAQRLAGASA